MPLDFDPEDKFTKPSKDLTKGDRIDTSKFTERTTFDEKTVYRDPDTKFMLSKDVAGNRSRGGSYWKLLDKKVKELQHYLKMVDF